jgi:hypothetical protein
MGEPVIESGPVALFIAGFLCAGFAVASLFFSRFWIRTRDPLFAAFAVAFLLMAANQLVAGFAQTSRGEDPRAYLLRLAAFVIIILAVLSKSSAERRASSRRR